jgi:hypothetical protein
MARNANNLMADFKAQLLADKRKSAVLAALFVTLLGVSAHALFGKPASAPADVSNLVAQPVQSVAPPPASHDASLKRPLPAASAAASASRNGRAAPRSAPGDGPSPCDPLIGDTVSVAGISRTPARDLFCVSDWSVFQDGDADEPSASDLQQSGEPNGAAGSAQTREPERSATELVEEAQKELADLQLQSTLIGAVRSAYISGRLVYEGETILGFEVVRINGGEVTLRKDGRLYALLMR